MTQEFYDQLEPVTSLKPYLVGPGNHEGIKCHQSLTTLLLTQANQPTATMEEPPTSSQTQVTLSPSACRGKQTLQATSTTSACHLPNLEAQATSGTPGTTASYHPLSNGVLKAKCLL